MTGTGPVPGPDLRHLLRMAGPEGVFEHACLGQPRPELGCCTDDAGRALALASRLPSDPCAEGLAVLTVDFLERAHVGDGRFRLRLGPDRNWTADAPSDDAAGRALFGLGVAASAAPWEHVRRRASVLFDASVGFRSRWPRATAYATLGAVEVLRARPAHLGARRLVRDAAHSLPTLPLSLSWQWPEPRLTYANALLPEATLAAAGALESRELGARALEMLDWLIGLETLDGRFSFTPVGGRGPGEPQPAFDQQAIEAWAMADGCARALAFTREHKWATALERAASWFLGNNDTGVAMFDTLTGGGFDGLQPDGANRNQGAESTMAFVATMAHLAALGHEFAVVTTDGDDRVPQAAARASSR